MCNGQLRPLTQCRHSTGTGQRLQQLLFGVRRQSHLAFAHTQPNHCLFTTKSICVPLSKWTFWLVELNTEP
jgi:hypothetical protein